MSKSYDFLCGFFEVWIGYGVYSLTHNLYLAVGTFGFISTLSYRIGQYTDNQVTQKEKQ